MWFLAMAGYYKKLSQDFSTVVASLTSLLSPNVRFVWMPACQDAFEKIKELISSTSVLAALILVRGRLFQVQVDATRLGAGVALLQVGEAGMIHAISYFSWKFSAYQLNYSIVDKEAQLAQLALLWAFAAF